MLDQLLVHTTIVEPHTGTNAAGDLFGPPVTLPCLVEDEMRLVRTDTGEEVVARSTVIYPVGSNVPAGSRVTVNGRRTTVLTTSRQSSGGLSPADHVEVTLQ